MGRIVFASQNVVPVSATVGGRVLLLAGEFATPFRRVGQSTRITLSTALANVTMTAGGKTSCCQYLDVCLEILPPPFAAKNHVGRNPLLQPPQPKISNFNATNSLSSGAERVGSFADLSMSLLPSLGQLSADRAHSWIKRAGAEPLTRQAVLCRFTRDVLLASSSQQLPREMNRTWLSIHVLNLIFRTLLVNASCPSSAEFPSALLRSWSYLSEGCHPTWPGLCKLQVGFVALPSAYDFRRRVVNSCLEESPLGPEIDVVVAKHLDLDLEVESFLLHLCQSSIVFLLAICDSALCSCPD